MVTPGRRRLVLVITSFFLLQVAWVITVPPFRGSDEVDHAYRAAAVARGEWIAGDPAEDGRGWLVTVPVSLVRAAHAQCEVLEYQGPDNCSPVASLPDGRVQVASSAAGYNPVYYFVVGTAGRPFDGAASLYAMRIISALLCLMFLGLAASATLRLPSRWPIAGLMLAASPVLVYSTTVLAPNGLEMSAALALWGSLLAIAHGQDPLIERRLFWVAIISAALLGILRLLGPLFIVLTLASVAALRWKGLTTAVTRNIRTFVFGCVLVGAAVGGLALWTFGPLALDPEVVHRDAGDAHFIASNLVVWPLQTIAAFPYRDQMGAAIVYPIVMFLVIALLQIAVRRSTGVEQAVVLGSLVVALALPVILTAATIGTHGTIWQGRYGLPYSVGFILMASYLAGSRSRLTELPWRLSLPAIAVYGVAVTACLDKVRAAELRDNVASRSDSAWNQPAPVLLALLVGLAMLCVGFTLSGWSREPT